MGRYLEQQYDKDYMRMAMLKQEETFKHQVTELHRLYRVQKLLMNDMMAEKRRQRNSSSNSRTKLERWNWSTDNEYSCQDQRRNHGGLDLGLPSEELYIMGNKHGRDVMLDVEEEEEEEEEECGLELTLATGSRSGRKKENSFASDSGASFSSSSTDQSGTGAKFNGSEWGVMDMNYHRERKSVFFDVEERMRGEMVKQPPWLFHCSSLNMT